MSDLWTMRSQTRSGRSAGAPTHDRTMARRKTFDVETPQIIPAGQGNRGWLWLLATLGLAAWTWIVYQHALSVAPQPSAAPAVNEASLLARIAELEEERDHLLEQNSPPEPSQMPEQDVVETVSEPTSHAAPMPDPVVPSAATEPATPSLAMVDLEVQGFSLTKAGDGYAYSFILARSEKGEDKIEGTLVLRVPNQGASGADRDTIGEAHKLGFRHFQSLEGQLNLPDDAMPSELQMELALTAPEAGNFIHTIPWATTDP